jgi:Domain of unknown function (DUF4333)
VSLRPWLPAAIALLALGLAACGSNDLAADSVAKAAEDALEAEAGARPDVSCPHDLPAEVGAKARCTLSVGEDPNTYGVTVRVTSIEGKTAHFDVEVDEEPRG